MNHSKSDINQHKRSRQSSPSPNASHAKHDPQAPIPSQLREGMIHMKNNYQTIPIPEKLKSQVESAIRQAKQDLSATPIVPADPTRHKKNLRISSWIKGISAGAAAALLALAILANTSTSIAHAMEQIPFLGAIVNIVTFREYGSHVNQMDANLKIPKAQVTDSNGSVLEDSTKEINDKIQSYTDKIIAAYEEDVKASGGKGMKSVDLDYEIATDNDRLFSLRFYKTLTMASAAQSEKIYHIDKETGDMVTLKDLFQDGTNYKELISKNIKEQMRAQMKADTSIQYYIADAPSKRQKTAGGQPEKDTPDSTIYYSDSDPLNSKWDFSKDFPAAPLEDGATEEASPSKESGSSGEACEENAIGNGFQEITDEVNFYVNESGKLVIVFDEYEVAPGYMGAVSFEIPTGILTDIIRDGFIK